MSYLSSIKQKGNRRDSNEEEPIRFRIFPQFRDHKHSHQHAKFPRFPRQMNPQRSTALVFPNSFTHHAKQHSSARVYLSLPLLPFHPNRQNTPAVVYTHGYSKTDDHCSTNSLGSMRPNTIPHWNVFLLCKSFSTSSSSSSSILFSKLKAKILEGVSQMRIAREIHLVKFPWPKFASRRISCNTD